MRARRRAASHQGPVPPNRRRGISGAVFAGPLHPAGLQTKVSQRKQRQLSGRSGRPSRRSEASAQWEQMSRAPQSTSAEHNPPLEQRYSDLPDRAAFIGFTRPNCTVEDERRYAARTSMITARDAVRTGYSSSPSVPIDSCRGLAFQTPNPSGITVGEVRTQLWRPFARGERGPVQLGGPAESATLRRWHHSHDHSLHIFPSHASQTL